MSFFYALKSLLQLTLNQEHKIELKKPTSVILMNQTQCALSDLIFDTIKNIQKHDPGEIVNWIARNLIAKYSLANDYYYTTQKTKDHIDSLGLDISKRGNKKKSNGYTFEHPIPAKVVFEELLIAESREKVDEILRFSDRVVILSAEEDSLLTAAKLRRSMPENWRFFDNLYARYDKIGSKVLKTKIEMSGAIKR